MQPEPIGEIYSPADNITPQRVHEMSADRTPLDLDAIRARADAATPGPWVPAMAPSAESFETPAEYLMKTMYGKGLPLWVAWAPNDTDDGFAYVVPAVTGDGPTSEANAEFIANARQDVPALLAEVTALLADLGAARAAHERALYDAHQRGWNERGERDAARAIPQQTIRWLAEYAMSQLFAAEQDMGCCPRCCGACAALRQLLDAGQLDDLMREDGPSSYWWDHVGGRVDRAWLDRAWRMTKCHDDEEATDDAA